MQADTEAGKPVFQQLMRQYELCIMRGGDKVALSATSSLSDLVSEKLLEGVLPASLWTALWVSTDSAVSMLSCFESVISVGSECPI